MRIAPVVALLLLLMTDCAVESRHDLLADYSQARASLASRKSGAPGLGVALNRAWSAVANWTAGFLDEHPDASAEQLAKAIIALEPRRPCAEDDDEHCFHLDATAVRLNGPPSTTFAVAANYPRSGTFFVVARARDGHFRAMWNIKDVALLHYASRDEIGYWAWTGGGWGDGPPTSIVGPLPRSASGHPRFYVDAVAAAEAGGTYRKQFSVWEWDGVEAKPLFIKSYQVSFETAPVTVKDGNVTIPSKGEYKSFFTCGMCPEPHVLRTLRVGPDGVHDLGTSDGEPEMRCVDELWDRLIHGQPAVGLASPEVVSALNPVVEDVKHAAGSDLSNSLGMIEIPKVSNEDGRRFLLIESEALDCGQLRFEIGSAAGGACLRTLRVLNPCAK